MTWAWSIELAPTSKLVLMALADIADDLGAYWPSHVTLAAKCSLTDRTVRRVLSSLQAQKLVVIESRFKTNRSRTSNRYRLAVDTPPDTGVLVTTISPGWQIRDLRAKAASDADTSKHAQALLGHSAATTTDGYIRRRVGEKVLPIEIAGKPQNFAGNDSDGSR